MSCLGGMSTWVRNSWIQCGQRWYKKTPNVSTIRFIGLYGMNHYFIMVNCIFGWRHMPYIPHYACIFVSWWRHNMETFSTLLALCERNPMTGRFLSQSAKNAEFWCFRCFSLNKLCNKRSSFRWFQTPKTHVTPAQWHNVRISILNHISKINATFCSDSFSSK